ncbi:MAG TPA: FimV/HubP family polar landmark protein [Usitatibacter sp.]|nr:FimV/HubP family polar landmark protein [Usitatibacter sp.]
MRIMFGGGVLALFLGASIAHAAGLGKLTVKSALGQPLDAEIELVSLQPGELDSLTARVAAPEAFRDARIEYSSSLRLLRFSVERRASGQAYLKVSSVAPINEPFVDALIEVTWPAGRIQREYPILLDPPGYAQGRVAPPQVSAAPSRAPETPPASAPAASSQTPAASSSAAPTAPETTGSGPSARAELTTSPPGAPRETPASGDTYGPIQKGETLRKIAEETKPADVSLEQMLVALYRQNPGAFVNNNMNRMKTGQILKVPTADEVTAIERKDANQEIRTHVADWNSYREQLAGGAGAIPSRPDSTNVAAGRVGSAAVTPPAPPAAEPRDVLKLSKSDAGKGAAGAGKGAGGGSGQDRVNAMQEELTAKDKALRESQSRVADLEKQIRDMQRLLELKGAPVTAAKPGDSKVATAPTPAPAPTKTPEPAKVDPKAAAVKPGEPSKPVDVKPAEPAKPADTKVAEAPKPAEPAKLDAPKPAEPPKVAEAPKQPATPPKTDVKAPAKKGPAAEKSFTDELLENPWYLMAGVGGLAALGIGAFLFARRRKDRAEAGPSSSMTSAFPSDLKPDSTTGKAGGGLVDTGNSSFLTDFDKTGPGTLDTDEVDPVAEAEVYIAYGRDAQAEEILKEAMARDKGRPEIALKLLEIYHARKSATAFETVAKELKGAVGESSPTWQKAAAMGAQIDPNNPLYGGAGGGTGTYAAPAAAAAKPDVDFDLEGSSSASSTAPAPDFDLDLDSKKAETTNSPASSGLDFDIAPSASAPSESEPHKDEKPSFDFDLSGLDMGGSKPAASGGTDLEVEPTQRSQPSGGASSSSFDLADLSLDSPGGDAGGGEAVGTKLELAKAYLEIGDKDGAREILQEVAKEGSSAQKEEAQKLIGSL